MALAVREGHVAGAGLGPPQGLSLDGLVVSLRAGDPADVAGAQRVVGRAHGSAGHPPLQHILSII